jgi:hypothetical protein
MTQKGANQQRHCCWRTRAQISYLFGWPEKRLMLMLMLILL